MCGRIKWRIKCPRNFRPPPWICLYLKQNSPKIVSLVQKCDVFSRFRSNLVTVYGKYTLTTKCSMWPHDNKSCFPLRPLLFKKKKKKLTVSVDVKHHVYLEETGIVQELSESRGGRPGLSVLTSLLDSVDVKLYWTMLRHWSQLVPNMSTEHLRTLSNTTYLEETGKGHAETPVPCPYWVGTRQSVRGQSIRAKYGQARSPYAALTCPYEPLPCPYRPDTGIFTGLVTYSLLTFISSVDAHLCTFYYIVSHVDFFCNSKVSGSYFISFGWYWCKCNLWVS